MQVQNQPWMMVLYRYFWLKESALPLPDGPLATELPASSIAAANINKTVKAILPAPKVMIETGRHACGPYNHFTAEKKARIRKRAAEHGVSATVACNT